MCLSAGHGSCRVRPPCCHSRMCEMSPPPPTDGRDQVLSDTGDAGDVAAASVTRDRRGQAALAAPGRCAAAVLQACSGSGHHPWCPPAVCSAAAPGPGHHQQQTAAGAGSVAKSWLFSHRQHNLHTLKRNIIVQFSFSDLMGLPGVCWGPVLRLCIISPAG